jgi:hypothetical protein
MIANRRKLSPFSLSFLDIMSCGFGAVVLLFLIIKHNVDANMQDPRDDPDLSSEVMLLEEEVLDGEKNLVRVRNTISEVDDQLAIAQGLARRIMEQISELEGTTDELVPDGEETKLETLKTTILRLESEKQQLITEIQQSGESARKFAGDGNRAYVTGLQLGGDHLLILLDTSASMLDKSIVNILRRRNMRDERKRTAPKWRNAVEIVDWLSAKFPVNGHFQIYTFNEETKAAIPSTKGQWLAVKNKIQVDKAFKNISAIIPEKGTNMEKAFAAIGGLSPLPNNVYLITDGLPTQGTGGSRGATISGRDRLKVFTNAVKKLPNRVPMNVILTHLEGDPGAAIAFWRLSQSTQGSFISPAEDWP